MKLQNKNISQWLVVVICLLVIKSVAMPVVVGFANNNFYSTIYLDILAVIDILLIGLVTAILLEVFVALKRENRQQLDADAEIRRLAFKDSLTGIDNRHHFFILANQALKMAQRSRSKFAVLYVDINNFKTINDRFGHKAGDEVLKRVSFVLKKIIRQSDIAARLGGDEFGLVFNNLKNEIDLSRFLEQLNNELSFDMTLNDKQFYLSASVGSAIYPKDGADIDSLLEKADSNMYRLKFKSKAEKRMAEKNKMEPRESCHSQTHDAFVEIQCMESGSEYV